MNTEVLRAKYITDEQIKQFVKQNLHVVKTKKPRKKQFK